MYHHWTNVSMILLALLFGFCSGGVTTQIKDPHFSEKFQTIIYHETSHKVGHRWKKGSKIH